MVEVKRPLEAEELGQEGEVVEVEDEELVH